MMACYFEEGVVAFINFIINIMATAAIIMVVTIVILIIGVVVIMELNFIMIITLINQFIQ